MQEINVMYSTDHVPQQRRFQSVLDPVLFGLLQALRPDQAGVAIFTPSLEGFVPPGLAHLPFTRR